MEDCGTAISEVLTDEYPAKLIRLGMKDVFGQSGEPADLLNYFELNSKKIQKVVLNEEK